MYKLGTLDQFNADNALAKKAAGWTQEEIKNGKAVDNGEGETVFKNTFLTKRQNPNGSDEYLWKSESGNIEDDFNILASWGFMSKPSSIKYYIADNNGYYIFGKMTPSSWPSFGALVSDIELFNTEKEYYARIDKLGISIDISEGL